jgi:site-specific DNA-methyltransferase (adenine-specific)
VSGRVLGLRLGDCLGRRGLGTLPDGAVDVTITDPPFDARTHRAALEPRRAPRGSRRIAGPLPFSPLAGAELERVAAEVARVTSRWILVFAAERQLEDWARALEAGGARFIRLGAAVRTNPRPQLSGDRPAPAVDLIVIAHGARARLRWNGRGRAARWDSPAARFDPGGQIHPTQKPLALVRTLVEQFSEPGELVCDPFAGGGTTAVACRELGRQFVGWELAPGFHAAARRRLAQRRPARHAG